MGAMTMNAEQPSGTERVARVSTAWRAFSKHARECEDSCRRGRDCEKAAALKDELRSARDAAGFTIPIL